MSIFSKIKDAIFGHAAQAAPVAAAAPAIPMQQAAPAAPSPMSDVDVEATVGSMSGAGALNWRTSIVDLMKVLGLDASYANRKELAHELGRAEYSGTAEDNIWLHNATMDELAKNGGKVPASMRA